MSQVAGVSLCYGKINLSNQGQTVAVLRLKAPFDKSMSATTSGKVNLQSKEYHQATRYRDIGGGFTRQRVEHAQGTLILLQVSRTRNAVPTADAAIVLRLREGADLLSIAVRLPVGPESVLGESIQVFVGSADIMSPADLKLMGIKVPNYFRDRYMVQEEIDDLIEVSVVRAGTISKPTLQAVATSEGVVIAAVGVEEPRRLRLRRGNAD